MAEFGTPLQLTSPTERSARVKDAQWLLSGHNAFDQDFHPAGVDGEYGPLTAGAAKQAKYLLGYPPKGIDTSFGQQLYEYLTGKESLPPAYATRRNQRAKEVEPATDAKLQALAAARTDAANRVCEAPVNLTPYGKWYGMDGVAWCCIYVTYRLAQAGYTGFERGRFASYCGDVVAAARGRQRGLALTRDPEPGDLVIYNGDEHIEFFVEWVSPGESFRSVGGNTSSHDGSPSNGGAVAENVRAVRDARFPVSYFVKVGAGAET